MAENEEFNQKWANFIATALEINLDPQLISYCLKQYQGTPEGFFDEVLKDPNFINKILAQSEPIKKKCGICMDEFLIAEMYTLDCPSSHRFCYNCLQYFVADRIKTNLPPTCPDPLCKYTLSNKEVEHLDPSVAEKYDQQCLIRALQSPEFVGCPSPNCTNYVAVRELGIKEKYECSLCSFTFCSLCKGLYHYYGQCTDLPYITQQWIHWVENGRPIYQQEQKRYGEELRNYEKKQIAIQQRNDELRKNFELEKADESYKESHCRVCPTCGKIVESLGGCDVYICGRDYHGGNVQQGCGTKFYWSKIQIYKSSIPLGPKQEQNEITIPELPSDQEVDHGEYRCDNCHDLIKGFRFSCIHCPCCNFCSECEEDSILSHSKDHMFRLINQNEDIILLNQKR